MVEQLIEEGSGDDLAFYWSRLSPKGDESVGRVEAP